MKPLYLLAMLALIGGAWFGVSRLPSSQRPAVPAEQQVLPNISVSTRSIDFGTIPQEDGPVTKTITVQNTGAQSLVINRISTSCGCTTATMDQQPLDAGATRALTITFDPMVHPDQTGPIQRAVYLQTSDPDEPEVIIDIEGTVVNPSSPL